MVARLLEDTCRHGHPRTPENTYTVPTTGIRVCRPCRILWRRSWYQRWRQENPDRLQARERRNNLWNRYRLTEADYDAILASQGGGCAICTSTDQLSVDHDHSHCEGKRSCGQCVRGILCQPCNIALAACNDDPARAKSGRFTDPELAVRAASYVQSFRLTLVGVA